MFAFVRAMRIHGLNYDSYSRSQDFSVIADRPADYFFSFATSQSFNIKAMDLLRNERNATPLAEEKGILAKHNEIVSASTEESEANQADEVSKDDVEECIPNSLADFVADADATLDAAKSAVLQSSPTKRTSSRGDDDDGSCFTSMTENQEEENVSMTEIPLDDKDTSVEGLLALEEVETAEKDVEEGTSTAHDCAPDDASGSHNGLDLSEATGSIEQQRQQQVHTAGRGTIEETGPVSVQSRVAWLESLGAAVMTLPSSLGIYRGEIVGVIGRHDGESPPALVDEVSVGSTSSKGSQASNPKASRSITTESESGSESGILAGKKLPYSSDPSVPSTESSCDAGDDDSWNEQESISALRTSRLHKRVGACVVLLAVALAGIIVGVIIGSRSSNVRANNIIDTPEDPLSNVGYGPGKRKPFEETPSPTRGPTSTVKEPTMKSKSPSQSQSPTSAPTAAPTTAAPTLPVATYVPGDLVVEKAGVLLSRGLDVKIIAKSDEKVKLADGTESSQEFHDRPDFGATFPDQDENNKGGWAYLSNSEVDNNGGGVGKIAFNSEGEVIGYEMLLTGTTRNCGGGKTPWNTWITCEEPRWERNGHIYEVDPFGKPTSNPKKTVLGGNGGSFESFSYDVRDKDVPRFFVTEDDLEGALRRFTPSKADWENPSNMLYGEGSMEFLVMDPNDEDESAGKYYWTTDQAKAELSARRHYRNSEGIDVADNKLFFVSKKRRELYALDLDSENYTSYSTQAGAFDGGSDQVVHILKGGNDESVLYFTEEGGEDAGIHGRDSSGRLFTILESPVYKEETTGLAFSPNFMHMYVAYQSNGILLDITREDGYPFNGRELNIKYHNPSLEDNDSSDGMANVPNDGSE